MNSRDSRDLIKYIHILQWIFQSEVCEIMIIFFVGKKNQFAKNFIVYRLSISRIEYGLVFRFYLFVQLWWNRFAISCIMLLSEKIWISKFESMKLVMLLLPSKKNLKNLHCIILVDLSHLNLKLSKISLVQISSFPIRTNVIDLWRGIPIWKIERGALLPSRSR